MIVLRPVLVLAMLAALLGAPPSASAAANVLHSPEAAPASGTTDTSFRLRVGFLGRFPAGLVEATVADRTVPMSLVAGSLLEGTWEAWVRLPAGQWPVSFTATALRGSSASLAGPTLTVVEAAPRASAMAPATAPEEPPAASSPDRTTHGADGSDAPAAGSSAPAPAPAPAEDPSTAPAPTEAAGSPGGDAPPTASSGPGEARTVGGSSGSRAEPSATLPPQAAAPASPAGASGGAGDGDREGAGDAAVPASSVPASSVPAASDGTLSMRQGSSPRPASSAVQAEGDAPVDEESATFVDATLAAHGLRVTAAWAAALLVVSAVLLGILARRRRRRDSAGAEVTEAEAAEAAEAAELILRRRALRRSRMVLPEDPIVASLGLDEDAEDRERRPVRRARHRDDAEPPT